ncbi:hypothetical protein Tco_1375935 [Tanacetum coccineum]
MHLSSEENSQRSFPWSPGAEEEVGEQIGSLAEFYKDTGHLTGNSTFHALMLARFANAWFWQAKLVASSRKRHVEKRGSRAIQVGSRAVHNGLLDAGVSPHRKI